MRRRSGAGPGRRGRGPFRLRSEPRARRAGRGVDIGSNSGRVMVYRPEAGGHLHILAGSRAPLRLVREPRRTPGASPPRRSSAPSRRCATSARSRAGRACRADRGRGHVRPARRRERPGVHPRACGASWGFDDPHPLRRRGGPLRLPRGGRAACRSSTASSSTSAAAACRSPASAAAGSLGRGQRAARRAAGVRRLPEDRPARRRARSGGCASTRAALLGAGRDRAARGRASGSWARGARCATWRRSTSGPSGYPIARLHGYVLTRTRLHEIDGAPRAAAAQEARRASPA